VNPTDTAAKPATDRTGEPWTAADLAILGRLSNRAAAAQLQRSYASCKAQRWRLKLRPPARAGATLWAARDLAELGKIPDAELAQRVGCSRISVLKLRQRLGIAASQSQTAGRPKKPAAKP
jgi:hypothetical protein